MNLRDLNYLVAVAEHGHFGRAAEVCHVSQPALSMQIRKLEEFLGVALFERTNKTVMITDAGREIVARARLILQEADNIREIADSFRDPHAGKILLGAFPDPWRPICCRKSYRPCISIILLWRFIWWRKRLRF